MDSANFVTMTLIDKGFYDYDFKSVDKVDKSELLTYEATVKNEQDTHSMLGLFGWKPQEKSANDMSVDELQQMAINELNKRKKNNKDGEQQQVGIWCRI